MADDDTKNRHDTPSTQSEDEEQQQSQPSERAPSPTALERLAPRHEGPELGMRIIRLIDGEPFEEAVASLGLALVFLLFTNLDDPLEAFDSLALRLRQALNEELGGNEAGPARVH
jgi:hypothetical protein